MLKSMTGYGSAMTDESAYTINAEIKTVNSKFLDANLRLPKLFADKEIEVKNLAQKILERGKVYLTLQYIPKGESTVQLSVNESVVKQYYESLMQTAKMLDAPTQDIFRTVMQQDGVFLTESDEKTLDKHWKAIHHTIKEALLACDEFRKEEGKKLQTHLQSYATNIKNALQKINEIEPERIEKIKEKLKKHMEEYVSAEQFNQNRFEQEVIYYAEKLDITEEQTRLESHIEYFEKEINSKKASGKKLGFVAQEMGREINTIGSKANDATIQQLVVEMKEELEKIKEQTLNVL